MPARRNIFTPSEDPSIRELQRAVLGLQPVDSPTVRWKSGPTGTSATVIPSAVIRDCSRRCYQARLVLEEDRTFTIRIWRGYRVIIGKAPTAHDPPSGDEWSFPIALNQTAYFGFTYSTKSTPGDWKSAGIEIGTDPADTSTSEYIRIATLKQTSDGTYYLLQRHEGEAKIEDRLVYEQCPAPS